MYGNKYLNNIIKYISRLEVVICELFVGLIDGRLVFGVVGSLELGVIWVILLVWLRELLVFFVFDFWWVLLLLRLLVFELLVILVVLFDSNFLKVGSVFCRCWFVIMDEWVGELWM